MKVTILSLLTIFLFSTSCTYKIVRNYQVPANMMNNDCNPKIVVKTDLFGMNTKYLGTIKLDDSGVTTNCSKSEAFSVLQEEACRLNANLVNITDEAAPQGLGSTCYRCIADFYLIEMDNSSKDILEHNYRELIRYNEKQFMIWSDFKRILPETSEIPYIFQSSIELRSGSASFWDGALKDFSAQAKLYTDVSGVKKSFMNQKNLKHIQGLYDIANIYSKKLENYLNSGNERTHVKMKIQMILDSYIQEMVNKQKDYMKETNFGQNIEEQNRWFEIITKEKKELSISN